MTQRDPYSTTDILEPVYRELRELKRHVAALENKSIPTVPTYDPSDFPQDSVEGQLSLSTLDLGEAGAHHFVDGEWWGVWHDAVLTSPWVVANAPLQYMKNMNGRLRLRGSVTGGTVGQPFTTVPIRFAPPRAERYTVSHGLVPAIIEFGTDGSITPLT
jgi:hypothetical protein